MGPGRRAVSVQDASAWVFNRMADVYDARPAYPVALVDALAALAGAPGARIVDIGAGTGHLALPLAARGFDVVAIEPAHAMLERLQQKASGAGLTLRVHVAAAESLPLTASSAELAVVADALHFLDVERTARELSRVLAPGAALALVTSQLGDTPFMRGVVRAMEDAAPRRPRHTASAITQLAALAATTLDVELRFCDDTTVDEATLEDILRSISFIGPAMNPQRFAAFRQCIWALPGPRMWSRIFTLHAGRRRT